MEIIFSAILIGFLLSTILIGPVFFLLIETSLRRSWKTAVVLDLGVIAADILCIAAAYYGSKDFTDYVTNHPKFYRIYIIAGFFVLIYGIFMYFSKPKATYRRRSGICKQQLFENIYQWIHHEFVEYRSHCFLVCNCLFNYDPISKSKQFYALHGSCFDHLFCNRFGKNIFGRKTSKTFYRSKSIYGTKRGRNLSFNLWINHYPKRLRIL